MNSKWFLLACRRDIVTRGLRVSGLVGTALVLINQGDVILSGAGSAELLWKVPLTFLVPYLVCTYASVSAVMAISTTGATATGQESD
jgi:hypothetical protein